MAPGTSAVSVDQLRPFSGRLPMAWSSTALPSAAPVWSNSTLLAVTVISSLRLDGASDGLSARARKFPIKGPLPDYTRESRLFDWELVRRPWNWPVQKGPDRGGVVDRKSTRLNSSHLGISYAVFC